MRFWEQGKASEGRKSAILQEPAESKIELRRQATMLDMPVAESVPSNPLSSKAHQTLKTTETVTPNDSKIQEDNVDG